MYQRKTVIRIGYEERTKYRLSRLSIAQGGRQFPLEEIEEIVLIRTYLQQDNMIAADLNVSIDRLEMTLRGRATAYELGGGQACPCVRRQRRPGRSDRCKQHLRNRMAAEKRTAADVSGGRPGRVVYTTDSSHENPRGPTPPARSAGRTCSEELKSGNDVVPGLRRGIIDPHPKHRESAL